MSARNSSVDSATRRPSAAKLERLSRIGLWAATLALMLAIGVMLYTSYLALSGNSAFALELLKEMEIEAYVTAPTPVQTWVATLFWLAVDILGVVMLIQVRALFHGFLHTGVFTEITSLRLRRIGLIVLAMGPVSILSGLLASIIISAWQTGAAVHASISIDDSDVYAIVIGLVITAASHIMLEAARLSEENQSFV